MILRYLSWVCYLEVMASGFDSGSTEPFAIIVLVESIVEWGVWVFED